MNGSCYACHLTRSRYFSNLFYISFFLVSVTTLSGSLGAPLGVYTDGVRNTGTLGVISSMYQLFSLPFPPTSPSHPLIPLSLILSPPHSPSSLFSVYFPLINYYLTNARALNPCANDVMVADVYYNTIRAVGGDGT
jgi:hypothetical protein